ncbi:hypothetical protein DPMN_006592 [Dreissena polymorpha]|uniref:Uncharacterized protein n=1 Tax=Dreissena polymorpha TaxID=45954 RepID=A0A9D4MS71_DREPO|nr:hypothetical protein DPMN_006592 [Dreissena polymorpha]
MRKKEKKGGLMSRKKLLYYQIGSHLLKRLKSVTSHCRANGSEHVQESTLCAQPSAASVSI